LWTPQRKLALFASLFRGREDVFPRRWEKPAKGTSGWAPRCDNEWKAGVCGKPRVKCGECPNQAFRTPAQSELLAHLRGRQVMGTYPLLADDTCWLLAIDLDGRSWQSDVKAIREVCEELQLAPAIERSRSGDGAHVWFFFSEPVPAALARRFGSMLLTNAMARTTTLGMASYDRLFPSQDTLPKGGFGNLIALPLQHDARQHGNTLFVDERIEPLEDQWSYLQSLSRISPERLQDLVALETQEGVLDASEEEDAPWRPARGLAERLATAELPGTLRATLTQRLYVCSERVPPGIGKTVIAAWLIAQRGRSTLVLVHRKPLLEQWTQRLNEFLDLDTDEIGTIGGGRGKPKGKVDVAMVQSLARHKTLDELLAGYGHIVVDECHHVPAVMTERVLQAAPARYLTGLTATPKRRDGHHPIITMQCGPVRHTIDPAATRSSQPLALSVVRRDTPFDPQTLPTDAHIQEVYAALAADERRTEMIAADTLELTAQGRQPIVLTERRDHLKRPDRAARAKRPHVHRSTR